MIPLGGSVGVVSQLHYCFDTAQLLFHPIVIGAEYLQSFPRQPRIIHGPAVAMHPTGLAMFLAMLTAVVVLVIQMKHCQCADAAAWHRALDRSLCHYRERLELQ